MQGAVLPNSALLPLSASLLFPLPTRLPSALASMILVHENMPPWYLLFPLPGMLPWLTDCLPHRERLRGGTGEREWKGYVLTKERRKSPNKGPASGPHLWAVTHSARPHPPSSIQKSSQNGLGTSASGSPRLLLAERPYCDGEAGQKQRTHN